MIWSLTAQALIHKVAKLAIIFNCLFYLMNPHPPFLEENDSPKFSGVSPTPSYAMNELQIWNKISPSSYQVQPHPPKGPQEFFPAAPKPKRKWPKPSR